MKSRKDLNEKLGLESFGFSTWDKSLYFNTPLELSILQRDLIDCRLFRTVYHLSGS